MESTLSEALEAMQDHPVVSGHRSGVGFLGALVLDAERIAADPDFPLKAYLAIRELGVISRAIGGDALQFSPPLTMTEAELDETMGVVGRGLDSIT